MSASELVLEDMNIEGSPLFVLTVGASVYNASNSVIAHHRLISIFCGESVMELIPTQ